MSSRRTFAVLSLFFALAWQPARADDVPGASPTSNGSLAAWSDLDSPWLLLRSAAERKLIHSSAAEGEATVRELLRSGRPRFRRAGAIWYFSHFESEPEDEVAAAEVVTALVREDDSSVRDALELAAAQSATAVLLVQSRARAGAIPSESLERVLAARTILLLERTMSDGGMPGFFDGQFHELFELDPGQIDRLTRIASDPRLNLVVRSLSIMALNEPRPPDLIRRLVPLLQDEDWEFHTLDRLGNPFRRATLDDDTAREMMVAKISQYARFSLAKAGIAGPIDRKIRVLQFQADVLRHDIARKRAVPVSDGTFEAEVLRRENDELMGLYFDIGYHHQQLDRYDEAERTYRLILADPESGFSKQSAWYNIACIKAIEGKKDEALLALQSAVSEGFRDVGWARRDGDLKSLRDDPRFLAILDGH